MAVPDKIAILLPSLKFGGAERVALNLAGAFKELGIQVDFLLMSYEGEFLAEAMNNFAVVDLQCQKTYQLPGRLLGYIAKNRPDVLISNFWKLHLCSSLVRVLFPFFKLLLWEHSPPSKSVNSPILLYALSSSILYQFATRVIVVSSGVYDDISHWTVGLHSLLTVIYNPIVPPDPYLVERVALCSPKHLTVVSVGRLDHPKNPGLLIEAFSLLPTDCQAVLIIVGDGVLRGALERRCQELGISDRVTFLGYSSNPYQVIAASDLLVVSSDREGLPSVIIEALYCGLPIVSTDCGGGVHDILLDGQYGTIVPVKDEKALAKAIENELKNRRLPQIQKVAAERFLPSVIVKQFLAVMG